MVKKTLTTNYKLLATVLKRIRLRTWISIGLIAILLPLVYFVSKNPGQSEAAWFDTSYGFRKRVPLTNSSGSQQTDFQVQITLDTATLISEGKMQADCDDVRVTGTGGKVLPYWMEPGTCNSASTLVWTKVPKIHTSGTNVFVYYGNPSAGSGSSTQDVFIRDIESAVAAWPLDDTNTDQSYSRVLNPAVDEGRNIILNGTFDTDSVWTKGTSWTIADGVAHSDGTGL